MAGPRIVSLIASATETVAALGFGDNLVGRSHECDYPATVRGLPACTAAKLDAGATSAEIDRQVKALVAGALSVYLVEAETLKELRPDVIVTQDQCEVCAVSLEEVEAAVCEWVDRSRPHRHPAPRFSQRRVHRRRPCRRGPRPRPRPARR